jgi:hypothetical protein
LLSLLAQANSPTGKGAWLELVVALAVLFGAAMIGWKLFINGSRWGELVVWSPIPLCILAIMVSMALGY